MLGAANSSIPPARTCDSISGSPPSWLLANTVTLSRPDDCLPIALAASVRRIVKGWVSGVFTPSLKSNSAAALAGLPKMVLAHVAEAAPSRPRRVIVVVFIIVFLPGTVPRPAAVSAEPASAASRGRNRSSRSTKPFCGNHETIPKQTKRTPLPTDGAQTPRRHHMNQSIHSADRSTHLKIVVVALVAGIAVAGFGTSARSNADFTQTAQSTHVMKAGKPVVVTSSDVS